MSKNTSRPAWFAALFCFLVLGACIPAPLAEDGTLAEAENGAQPVPDREIELQMAAGPIGQRLLVTNHSSEPFENLVMIVNEDDNGGYTLKISRIESQASMHFGLNAFRDSNGERYDPDQSWVRTVTVFADTPSGHGRWRSSYPKR